MRLRTSYPLLADAGAVNQVYHENDLLFHRYRQVMAAQVIRMVEAAQDLGGSQLLPAKYK